MFCFEFHEQPFSIQFHIPPSWMNYHVYRNEPFFTPHHSLTLFVVSNSYTHDVLDTLAPQILLVNKRELHGILVVLPPSVALQQYIYRHEGNYIEKAWCVRPPRLTWPSSNLTTTQQTHTKQKLFHILRVSLKT